MADVNRGYRASALLEPVMEPLQFDIHPSSHSTAEEVALIGQIQQVAEGLLYHWKSFPIVLPQSLTNIGDEKSLLNYHDLFVAPTFDELEQVATDSHGNLKKLSEAQLQGVWDRGEFEVVSANFPGQVHRWKLTQLLQKGSLNAHDSLLSNTALALRLLIITAKNRFISPVFSLSESVKSWGRGFWKLLDLLFGMPSTSPGDLERKVKAEHQKYLIAELDVKHSYRQSFSRFSNFVRETSRLSTRERRLSPELRPPAIPYIYQTPKGLDIDLRLFNKDLMNHCLPILSNILAREAKGWYVTYRQKMILNLKGEGLGSEEISKRVNEAVKEEYLHRVYNAILNNAELETIEPGIGELLVNQAKSVILMKKATKNLHTKMQTHKTQLLDHLKKAYPVKSRIPAWVMQQTHAFEVEFIQQNLWCAHEEAISLCEEEQLHQTVYFIRRDLNFIKERELILMKELEKVRIPNRVFTFAMRIWLPSNWVTIRWDDDHETRVTTQLSDKTSDLVPVRATHSVSYRVEKYHKRKTSTRYPLWRWYNYLQRTWTWMWNSIFLFGVVLPWCSPLSVRALLSTSPFMPDYKISQTDGVLYKDRRSTTQTLVSRVAAIWASVRKSRKDFEAAPDRGFLGKSLIRHFNRFWNYILKGFFGTVLLVITFPILCIVATAVSVTLALTAPVWTPLLSLLFHMFCIVFYDFDRPEGSNGICILLEAIVWRFLIMGIIQPVTASIFGFIVCPLGSLAISIFGVVRRGLRGFWDTIMYNIVIKTRARVPANDGFVARRIAGPGLASNYFYQIRPEQALAALDASMETEELELFKKRAIKMIEQPVNSYRQFTERVFKPFSASVAPDIGVYKQLLAETSNYKTDLTNKINQRTFKLNLGLDYDMQNKVKLPERELKMTIVQAARLLENFYLTHIINQLTISEKDFWECKTLEYRDWRGLAGQKLAAVFSPSFLVPLEDTDNHFELKVQHLNLGRYIHMIENTSVHDDLDVVTEVHSNTGQVITKPPSMDVSFFNPAEKIVQTHHFRSLRKRRFPWSPLWTDVEFDKLAVPLPIPHPAVIALSIYNRENEMLALNMEDMLSHAIIKAVKSQKAIADRTTSPSLDLDAEPSTPDNHIEPVSVISHLAEQEHSFSDDSNDSPSGLMLPSASVLPSVSARGDKRTFSLEKRVDMFADDNDRDDDDDSVGNRDVVRSEHVHVREADDTDTVPIDVRPAAQGHDTASIDTTNDVQDDVYNMS